MSDVQWEQWGKQDPYFGVYSESRFSKDQIDNHREEFFATGTKMVDVLLDRAKRYFGPAGVPFRQRRRPGRFAAHDRRSDRKLQEI